MKGQTWNRRTLLQVSLIEKKKQIYKFKNKYTKENNTCLFQMLLENKQKYKNIQKTVNKQIKSRGSITGKISNILISMKLV